MAPPTLDTRAWNLSMGLVASTMLAACGPMIIPEGETDTDSSTVTNPGPGPTSTSLGPDEGTTSPGCGECPSSYVCVDGECVDYNDDYSDSYSDDYNDTCGYYGDYCDTDSDTYDPPDTDTFGRGCYSHDGCEPPNVCAESNECEEAPALLSCPDTPVVAPLVLPSTNADAFVSLAFVDADGDPAQDLVVGRDGSAELLLGPGDGPPIALPVPPGAVVIDATAGDFDGDGTAELVVSTQAAELLLMSSDGAGGYTLTLTVAVAGPMVDLATLQWNGDGMLDLAGRVEGGQAIVHWGDGAGGFMEVYGLVTDSPVVSLAPTDLDGDGYGDLLVQDQDGAKRYEGSNQGNLTHDGLLPAGWVGARGLLSAGIDPGAPYEAIGYTLGPSWTLVELWPNALESPQYYGFTGEWLAAGMGDVDADGAADLVLGDAGILGYARGTFETGPPSLACVSTIEHQAEMGAMAVGDFDGNLRADVALGSSAGVTVLLTQ